MRTLMTNDKTRRAPAVGPARKLVESDQFGPQPGLKIARIFGIEVRLDWGLAVIFVLVAANLGAGVFPAQHPQWGTGFRWATAIVAATLFLASVLAHELAHAVVGRRFGLPVERITLFLFGGRTEMHSEPKSPKAELAIAAVGPLTSLLIGICALLAARLLAPLPWPRSPNEALTYLRAMGPGATLLFWLVPFNVLLAVFNLLPGFPLDGGRVLRSLLWGATGDLERATRWASAVGRGLAMLLMFAGILMLFGWSFPLLGRGFGQGLWLLLIGWFLNSAALHSYQAVVVRGLFEGLPVSRLMRTQFGGATVSTNASLEQLADNFLNAPSERCLPVVEAGHFVGLVCLTDLGKVARSEWAQRRVGEIMTPFQELEVTTPAEDVVDAMGKLVRDDVDQLPVVDQGRVRGFLRRADIMRWLELRRAGA
jgi:Zn-dependent protease/CBS domain-containing protein